MYNNSVLQISSYRSQLKPLPVASTTDPKTSATIIDSSHPDSSFFRMLESNNLCLNQQQINIITSKSRHMIINALAGTGKTSCITALTAYMISMEGTQPSSILLLAYTKKSSIELQERIQNIIPDSEINVSTFHSLCYKILRSNGFKQYKLLTDDNTRTGIINSILRSQGYVGIFQADSLLTLNSYYINTMTTPDDGIIKSVLDEYMAYKKEHTLMDFDDILLETYELLRKHERLTQLLHHRFKSIVVDEIQDLNPLQYCILKQLCSKDTILYCFGDINQSIFSFRGSDPNIMKLLKKDFPESIEMNMNINYRCTASILGVANKVLNTHNTQAPQLIATKANKLSPLFARPNDSIAEAKYIVHKIADEIHIGTRNYCDYAILFRSSTAATALFEELLSNNIPFITSGVPETVYQHPVAKLLTAHLKLSINMSDLDSFLGILPSLYLSKIRIMQYLNKLPDCNNSNLFEVTLENPELKDYQYDILQRRMELLCTLDTAPAYALQQLFADKAIQKHLNISGVSVEASDEAIQEIKNRMLESAYQYNTIREYLSHIDEVTEKIKEHSKNETLSNAINVMSIHAAKGLEFPVIFLIGAIEGVLPHKNVLNSGTSLSAAYDSSLNTSGSINEEQRLLYVATTRAKEELIISAPYHYNGSTSKISRFLEAFAEYFSSI